jgi:imidazolonepropionase-like amidohydrolase
VLIVVDGDPLADITLFADTGRRVLMFMKNGDIVKNRL